MFYPVMGYPVPYIKNALYNIQINNRLTVFIDNLENLIFLSS